MEVGLVQIQLSALKAIAACFFVKPFFNPI